MAQTQRDDTVTAYLSAIGRRGGSVKSPAKTAASRANGSRPKAPRTTIAIANIAGGDERRWTLRAGHDIPSAAYAYDRKINSGVYGGSAVDISGPDAEARRAEWDAQLADNAYAREQDAE